MTALRNDDEAKAWLAAHWDVSRETFARLDAFVAFLREEAAQQNLISAATLDHIWVRHIADSAQLLRFVTEPHQSWLDLGSGAGFPGLIVAMLSAHRVTLVESRSKRVAYLHRAIERLGLANVHVEGVTVERVETAPFSVISARAFAPLPRLLDLSHRFSTNNTLWLLPKGRNAVKELHEAHGRWNLDFAVEPSATDEEAGILVGRVLNKRTHTPVKGRRTR